VNLNHRDTEDTEIFEELSEELNSLTHQVIDAAIEVHRVLGPGFLESIYEEALCVELSTRSLRFVRQPVVAVEYKGRPVGESRLDLLIENKIVVELKAVDALAPFTPRKRFPI
jgi:GxxExxY protein